MSLHMFGCVIDTLGYRDFEQLGELSFSLPIPDVNLINLISVFIKEPDALSEAGAQVLIEVDGKTEPVGFLTDFQPSITFLSPKQPHNTSSKEIKTAQILIVATPLEDCVQREIHCLSDIENQMVDFQLDRIMTHFHDALEPHLLNDDGKMYLPLSQIQNWKEREIRYLQYTK